jgi:hypothetical protein
MFPGIMELRGSSQDLRGWNQETGLSIFLVGNSRWSCGERHMSHYDIPVAFLFAAAIAATFFGSVALALSWLG